MLLGLDFSFKYTRQILTLEGNAFRTEFQSQIHSTPIMTLEENAFRTEFQSRIHYTIIT